MAASLNISDQSLIAAFRKAARRSSRPAATPADLRYVREVMGQSPAVNCMATEKIVDLRQVAHSLVLKLPAAPTLHTSLQGRQWLLSVCVPRPAKRRLGQPNAPNPNIPSVFAGIYALPDYMQEVARLTAERIIHLWSTPQVHAHRDLLKKVLAVPPRVLASLSPILGAWYSKHASGGTAYGHLWQISVRRLFRLMLKLRDADLLPWLPGLLSDVLARPRIRDFPDALAVLRQAVTELQSRGISDVASHVASILNKEFPSAIHQ